MGPAALEILADEQGVPLPNERCVGDGAWLDADAREITVWWGGAHEVTRSLAWLSKRWPGYAMTAQTDGLPAQVERSGRSAAGLRLDAVTAARELGEVFSFDPEGLERMSPGGEIVQAIVADIAPG